MENQVFYGKTQQSMRIMWVKNNFINHPPVIIGLWHCFPHIPLAVRPHPLAVNDSHRPNGPAAGGPCFGTGFMSVDVVQTTAIAAIAQDFHIPWYPMTLWDMPLIFIGYTLTIHGIVDYYWSYTIHWLYTDYYWLYTDIIGLFSWWNPDFSAFSASRHSCNSSPAEGRHRAPDDCGCTNCGSRCRLDPTWNKKGAEEGWKGIGFRLFWTENHGNFGFFFVFFLGFYGFLPSTTKGFLWLFSPKSGWIHSAHHYQPSPYVYGICGLTWNFACIKIPMSPNTQFFSTILTY